MPIKPATRMWGKCLVHFSHEHLEFRWVEAELALLFGDVKLEQHVNAPAVGGRRLVDFGQELGWSTAWMRSTNGACT